MNRVKTMEGKLSKRSELKKLYAAGTITIGAFKDNLAALELQSKKTTDNMAHKKAWVHQTTIINSFEKEGRPTMHDVIGKISMLKKEKYKALFILLYLTAARISEVVKITTKRHIETTMKQGRPFLEIRLENRKNRTKKFKNILIPMDYPKEEKELANQLLEYVTPFDKDKVLFPMTKNAVHHYFKKYIGWNCHIIRHLRCTHLLVMYGTDPELLKKMAGWSDLRPAKTYLNLITDDLINIFPKENKNEETTNVVRL